jgi:glyoxylase-like metal-dependent hydrolase (beta-lactamase superfamily II)
MHTNNFARRDFLRVLAAGALTVSTASRGFGQAAQQAAQAPTPIVPTKLADRIYVLIGNGGNVGLITGDDGLMMIDCGLPDRGNDMVSAVAAVSPLKVQQLLNTHFHFDHTGGNETFGRGGTKIMAHENVKKILSIRFQDDAFGRTFEPLKPEGIPTETFTSGGKMTFGKVKMEYTHFAEAHTDGDTYVFFPEANILHCGDLFWNRMYPVIDYSAKGWLGGMIGGAAKMGKVGNEQTRVIPGHGEVGTKADLKAWHDMLVTVQGRLEPMAKQGKTMDEVLAAAPTKDLDAMWGKLRPADAFLKQAYPSLMQHGQKA